MAKNTALAAFKSGLKAKKSGVRRKPKMTIPLAVVAGFIPMGVGLWGRRTAPKEMARYALVATTGIDFVGKRWTSEFLGEGAGAILAGFLVHKLANVIGINRMLARSKVPFIRI